MKGVHKTVLIPGKKEEDNSSAHGTEAEKLQHHANLCSLGKPAKGIGERRGKQACSTKLKLEIQ